MSQRVPTVRSNKDKHRKRNVNSAAVKNICSQIYEVLKVTVIIMQNYVECYIIYIIGFNHFTVVVGKGGVNCNYCTG